ncbi:MAG: hypothetical protein LBU34_11130 [Planctomycetaceae bacterium]|jgi:hypothetical protein|nr:hypothetical protein [Planctomycetaceae bacterium]
MSLAPSHPDWQWFCLFSLQEIKQFADKNPNVDWLQKASVWVTDRNNSQGPPENYVPVLTTNDNGGQLGFLSVDKKRTYGNALQPSEFESHAYDAAKIIFDLFRPFQHDLGEPLVDIYLDKTGGGSSLSLPAMIAALQRLTGIRLPDTVISTGCLTNKELTPADPDTLSLKIETAKQFGYKTLIVVTEQIGIPQDCGLEIIKVDTNPLIAIFQLINSKLTGAIPKDRHIARLLFSADRLQQLKDNQIIESFLNNNYSELVHFVACDILSRSALHQGKTTESDQYRKQIGQLPWNKIPNDYLGHYLCYERFAATSILEIDLGIWNDEHETHKEVDKRLEHLQNAIKYGYADRNDYFGALTLANARALRKCFLARYEQNFDRLESAWHDLIFLFDDWNEIFVYAQRIDKKSTLARQRNYCLECLMDYWKINKCLPKWEKVDEFLTRIDKKNKTNDAYDMIAQLNYCVIKRKLPSENNLKQLIEKNDLLDVTEYPNWILYENILRFEIGNVQQRQYCLEKLREVPESSKDNASITVLLALRTRQILIDNGAKQILPLTAPPEGTRLREIYDNLISTPEILVDRCPY